MTPAKSVLRQNENDRAGKTTLRKLVKNSLLRSLFIFA